MCSQLFPEYPAEIFFRGGSDPAHLEPMPEPQLLQQLQIHLACPETDVHVLFSLHDRLQGLQHLPTQDRPGLGGHQYSRPFKLSKVRSLDLHGLEWASLDAASPVDVRIQDPGGDDGQAVLIAHRFRILCAVHAQQLHKLQVKGIGLRLRHIVADPADGREIRSGLTGVVDAFAEEQDPQPLSGMRQQMLRLDAGKLGRAPEGIE